MLNTLTNWKMEISGSCSKSRTCFLVFCFLIIFLAVLRIILRGPSKRSIISHPPTSVSKLEAWNNPLLEPLQKWLITNCRFFWVPNLMFRHIQYISIKKQIQTLKTYIYMIIYIFTYPDTRRTESLPLKSTGRRGCSLGWESQIWTNLFWPESPGSFERSWLEVRHAIPACFMHVTCPRTVAVRALELIRKSCEPLSALGTRLRLLPIVKHWIPQIALVAWQSTVLCDRTAR